MGCRPWVVSLRGQLWRASICLPWGGRGLTAGLPSFGTFHMRQSQFSQDPVEGRAVFPHPGAHAQLQAGEDCSSEGPWPLGTSPPTGQEPHSSLKTDQGLGRRSRGLSQLLEPTPRGRGHGDAGGIRGQEEAADRDRAPPLRSRPPDPNAPETPDPWVTGAGGDRQGSRPTRRIQCWGQTEGRELSTGPLLGGHSRGQQALASSLGTRRPCPGGPLGL